MHENIYLDHFRHLEKNILVDGMSESSFKSDNDSEININCKIFVSRFKSFNILVGLLKMIIL